jgi:hypothetical protein
MQDDFFLRRELEELESKAKEGRGFLADSIGATDEGEFDGAIAESGGIETKTLFFPVVRVDNAIANGFFEEKEGVLTADQGASVAAVIEHAGGICLVCHDGL